MTHPRKIISAIAKYAEANFSEADWYTLGEISGGAEIIANHGRLLRSLDFGDPDYPSNVAEVMFSIFRKSDIYLYDVVDHFDVDEWFKDKFPDKHPKVFGGFLATDADFWKSGYIRMFVSHLSSNKIKMSQLKENLDGWGISAFVAHEDIEVSREWRDEIELGLSTMDILIAVVEDGFKESDWCYQEVGFALGRGIDVIPLRAGADPLGFISKYQGLQVKGKIPRVVAEELAYILLKKNTYRSKVLNALLISLPRLDSETKLKRIEKLDEWNILSDLEMRSILEGGGLSKYEKAHFSRLIQVTQAFEVESDTSTTDEGIPF